MKKFLKKLPVMISLWSVTLIVLIAMIVMAARPVSYGWAYKCDDKDIFGLGEEQEISLVFDDGDELEMYVEMDGLSFEMEWWYLRNGKKYMMAYPSSMPSLIQDYMGEELMTEDDFEDYVRYLRSDRQAWREMWASADKINAFKCEMGGEEFVCTGAILFTVISCILIAAGITFSTLSTVAFVQDKKDKKKEAATVEETASTETVETKVEE